MASEWIAPVFALVGTGVGGFATFKATTRAESLRADREAQQHKEDLALLHQDQVRKVQVDALLRLQDVVVAVEIELLCLFRAVHDGDTNRSADAQPKLAALLIEARGLSARLVDAAAREKIERLAAFFWSAQSSAFNPDVEEVHTTAVSLMTAINEAYLDLMTT